MPPEQLIGHVELDLVHIEQLAFGVYDGLAVLLPGDALYLRKVLVSHQAEGQLLRGLFTLANDDDIDKRVSERLLRKERRVDAAEDDWYFGVVSLNYFCHL